MSNVTSYSCWHKFWCRKGRTLLRHWIFVYSLFLDPCLWLSILFLWLSKFDSSFNAHLSGLSNNRAHADTAPSQNVPHPHCLCLASHQMQHCIIMWQSIHNVLIVEAMLYVSFGSGPLLRSLVKVALSECTKWSMNFTEENFVKCKAELGPSVSIESLNLLLWIWSRS